MVNETMMNKTCMPHASYTPAIWTNNDIKTLSGLEHHFAEADVIVHRQSLFYFSGLKNPIGTIVGYQPRRNYMHDKATGY